MRRALQYITLALFLGLCLLTTPAGQESWLVNLFIRIDPFLALGATLAARRLIMEFTPAVLLVGLTVLLGRAWCGWLCPLGTLLELVHLPRLGETFPPSWRRIKYALLFLALAGAIIGSPLFFVLDPLTILARTLAVVSTLVKGRGFYGSSVFFAALFAAIVALNLIAPRFWCRVLCPLGALLGLFSRVALFRRRIKDRCTQCGLCTHLCPMEAIDPQQAFATDPGECMVCLTCRDRCPQQAIAWSWGQGPLLHSRYDPTRRQFLASLLAGGAGAFLLRKTPPPGRLRPPGASEEELLSRCIRCGECIKVCPTGGLQPDLGNLAGLGTPVFVPRRGYCSYHCNACGQVCPSGAIPPLSLEEKRSVVIGRAVIDHDRCLPWAHQQECQVCSKTCPLNAIQLFKVKMVNKLGETITVKCPELTPDLCNGCGICEYNCPVPGPGAISIRPEFAS